MRALVSVSRSVLTYFKDEVWPATVAMLYPSLEDEQPPFPDYPAHQRYPASLRRTCSLTLIFAQ